MRIFLKGFLLVLNCSFGSEESPSIAVGLGLVWCKRDGGVNTSYLVQLSVNDEEMQVMTDFPAFRLMKGSRRAEELNKHPKTCKRCYVRNLSCAQCSSEVSESQLILHRAGVYLVQLYVNDEEMQVIFFKYFLRKVCSEKS